MSGRRALTHCGCDIELSRRTAEGRAVFFYLDRHGARTRHGARAWPHELRGIGWHIAAIKDAISRLPLEGTAPSSAAAPALQNSGRFLAAHYSLPEEQ